MAHDHSKIYNDRCHLLKKLIVLSKTGKYKKRHKRMFLYIIWLVHIECHYSKEYSTLLLFCFLIKWILCDIVHLCVFHDGYDSRTFTNQIFKQPCYVSSVFVLRIYCVWIYGFQSWILQDDIDQIGKRYFKVILTWLCCKKLIKYVWNNF